MATAFLFPSLEEGHARGLLEALASGAAVIATRESGACDLPALPAVRSSPFGTLMRSRSAIWRIYRTAQDAVDFRRAARSIAEAFTWDRYVAEHLLFYPAVMRGPTGAGDRVNSSV